MMHVVAFVLLPKALSMQNLVFELLAKMLLDVSRKLCVLKCVLNAYLYRFTVIVDTGIDDNIVINENNQK